MRHVSAPPLTSPSLRTYSRPAYRNKSELCPLQNIARNRNHYSSITGIRPSMVSSRNRCQPCMCRHQHSYFLTKMCCIRHASPPTRERAQSSIYMLSQMCSLCDDVGRGVHFNPYVKVGGQVGSRSLLVGCSLHCNCVSVLVMMSTAKCSNAGY